MKEKLRNYIDGVITVIKLESPIFNYVVIGICICISITVLFNSTIEIDRDLVFQKYNIVEVDNSPVNEVEQNSTNNLPSKVVSGLIGVAECVFMVFCLTAVLLVVCMISLGVLNLIKKDKSLLCRNEYRE